MDEAEKGKFSLEKTSTAYTNATLTDEEHLAQLGHVQELRREFSIWSLGSLCLCLMATWEALSSVVAAALTNGGPPCLFYNYIISFLGTVAIACSLGEIASIYPTAGGQYPWVANLAPPNTRAVASWFTGWISVGGQIVLAASAAFAAGLQLQGLITINNPDTYVPERWQGMLFYWLVLAYSAAVNIWGSKILPHTNLASGVLHLAGFIAIVIVLSVMAPKHDAKYVFTEFSNSSGWTNDGVSWLVGLLSTVYPFLGIGTMPLVRLAEELIHPARNVPIAMVGSVLVNGIMGFGYAIVLLISLGDLNELLTSPIGFPFMQLFLNVTKSTTGATILSLSVSLIAVAATAAGLTSTSRTACAFARDSAIPSSRYFARVNSKLKVPVRMVVCITILEGLLGFIYIGNTTAFNAILSMAILGMYASYLLPIVYMLLYGRKQGRVFGPFRLGRIGGVLTNIIAICWLVFAMIFSTFPNFEPVNAQNMNYSTVVLGGWLFFGALYYFLSGRKQYSGPLSEVEEA